MTDTVKQPSRAEVHAERMGWEVVPQVDTFEINFTVTANSPGSIHSVVSTLDQQQELSVREFDDPRQVADEYTGTFSAKIYVPVDFVEPPWEVRRYTSNRGEEVYLPRTPKRAENGVTIRVTGQSRRAVAYLSVACGTVCWESEFFQKHYSGGHLWARILHA